MELAEGSRTIGAFFMQALRAEARQNQSAMRMAASPGRLLRWSVFCIAFILLREEFLEDHATRCGVWAIT